MSRRAVAPVVGVSLLIAVTLVLAVLVGAFTLGVSGQDTAPQAAITGERNGNEISLTHRGGDPLDVRDLTVRVFVDGEPLEHQPDVPFFSQNGFHSGPTGPFNSNTANKIWTAGETASFTIASTTNSPQPSVGSHVTVRIYADGTAVAVVRM